MFHRTLEWLRYQGKIEKEIAFQIDKPITGVCDLLHFGPLPRCSKPELHSYTIWILQVLHKPPTLLTVLSKQQAHGRSTDK